MRRMVTFPRVPMKAWMALYAVALFLAAASFFSQTRVEAATPPAFVNALASAGGKQTAVVLTVPTSVTDGDLMIAHVVATGGTSTTITPPTGATWNLINSTDSTTDVKSAIYYRVASSETAGTTTYSWGLSASLFSVGAVVAYSGVDTSSPIDISGGQANISSASVTAPAVITTVTDTMVVAFFTVAVNAAYTAPADMTSTMRYTGIQTGANGATTAAGDVTQTAAGSTGTKVATSDTADVNVGQIIALTPASGPQAYSCPGSPPPGGSCPTGTSSATALSTVQFVAGMPRESTATITSSFGLGFPRESSATFTDSFGFVTAFNRTSAPDVVSTTQNVIDFFRSTTADLTDPFNLGLPRESASTFTDASQSGVGFNRPSEPTAESTSQAVIAFGRESAPDATDTFNLGIPRTSSAIAGDSFGLGFPRTTSADATSAPQIASAFGRESTATLLDPFGLGFDRTSAVILASTAQNNIGIPRSSEPTFTDASQFAAAFNRTTTADATDQLGLGLSKSTTASLTDSIGLGLSFSSARVLASTSQLTVAFPRSSEPSLTSASQIGLGLPRTTTGTVVSSFGHRAAP